MSEPSGGMLSRWSRRKAAARDGALPEESEADALQPQVEPAPEAAEAPPVATAEDEMPVLPDIDSLHAGSDFSAFMHEKVPAALRRRALRKLFASPEFNFVDGLDDYDDDFRQILPLGDIVTSDMRHQQELAEQRAREAAEEQARQAALEAEENAPEEMAAEASEDDDVDPVPYETGESDSESAEPPLVAAGDATTDNAALDGAAAGDAGSDDSAPRNEGRRVRLRGGLRRRADLSD